MPRGATPTARRLREPRLDSGSPRLSPASTPDREDPAHRGVELDSTLAPARLDVPEGEDAIAEIAKLAPLVLSSSKLSNESATTCENPRGPGRRFPWHRRRSPSELALRIDVREHFLHVAAWERLESPTHQSTFSCDIARGVSRDGRALSGRNQAPRATRA